MSPEQAVSDTVDARADVYGLGVLMYRMFSGRLPFTGAEASEMLARHVTEEPRPLGLAAAADGLPAGVEAIVRKALRKRPEHRYASMEALLGDLMRLDRGESLSARLPLDAPDVYVPREPFAQQAVVFLQQRLGKEPPR